MLSDPCVRQSQMDWIAGLVLGRNVDGNLFCIYSIIAHNTHFFA